MAKITLDIPAALKKRMDARQDIDWTRVAEEAFTDMFKRAAKADKTVDKSSVLRTKLFRVPTRVTTAWGSFFAEKPKKKAKRKPF